MSTKKLHSPRMVLKCHNIVLLLVLCMASFHCFFFLKQHHEIPEAISQEDKEMLVSINTTLRTLNQQLKAAKIRRDVILPNVITHSIENAAIDNAAVVNLQQPKKVAEAPVIATSQAANKKALIFTMDSISTYEANSQRGGPAGDDVDNPPFTSKHLTIHQAKFWFEHAWNELWVIWA